MKIILSAAMSQDGYLDDASPQRRIFSCQQDLKEVEKLRASCDAILVGAQTVRKDNPSLITRDAKFISQRKKNGRPPDPIKVTITKSGALDPTAKFFCDGAGEKIVYHTDKIDQKLSGFATLAPVDGIPAMLADLKSRGIKNLLVEGGAKILEQFLDAGTYDEFRLAIAPVRISDANAPCLCRGSLCKLGRAIRKEPCGTMEVIHFVPAIRI